MTAGHRERESQSVTHSWAENTCTGVVECEWNHATINKLDAARDTKWLKFIERSVCRIDVWPLLPRQPNIKECSSTVVAQNGGTLAIQIDFKCAMFKCCDSCFTARTFLMLVECVVHCLPLHTINVCLYHRFMMVYGYSFGLCMSIRI